MKSTSTTLSVLRWVGLWIVWPLILAFILEATFSLYHSDPAAWMYDMKVYVAGVQAVLNGVDPYSASSEYGEVFTYPPFALLPFLPLGWMSINTIALVWTAINVASLQISIYLPLKHIGVKRLVLITTLILLPSLFLLPVDQTIHLGQINLVLLALVLIDLHLPDTSRFKGSLLGFSAGIKIIPGLFVIYYFITRRFRAAVTLCLTAIGTVVLAFAIFPRYSYDYWTHYIFDTTRVARVTAALPNEALRGMLARVLYSEEAAIIPWIISSAIVLGIAIIVTWYAAKSGEDFIGIAAIALAGLLITPVAWHHLWVWVIPITIYLASIAYRRRSKILWLCAAVPLIVIAFRMNIWFIPDPFRTRPLYGIQLITSNIVTFTSILLLIGLLAYTTLGRPQATLNIRQRDDQKLAE